jgi:hypothetical protein
MTRRLLDYNHFTGEITWHDYDPVTKETHIHTEWTDAQTDAVLDSNKAAYTDGTNGWSPTREWKRVAEIPFSVLHDWLVKEGWWAFDANATNKLRQKLNSSEYLYLRTAPGQL